MGLYLLIDHHETTDDGAVRSYARHAFALPPLADHDGYGLKFMLGGLVGEKVVVGVFDPDVNAAAAGAARQREQGIEPADGMLPPAMSAAMFYSAFLRREELRDRASKIEWDEHVRVQTQAVEAILARGDEP